MPNPRFLRTAERWMNKEIPEIHPKAQPKVSPISISHSSFSIDDILKGKTFYSNEQDNGKYIGVPVALQQALVYAGAEGIVASMPYLVAGKAAADKKNYLWKEWFTALSEENIGIDKSGIFVKSGKPVVITVHGGGILKSDRIRQAYNEGLTGQNAAKYTNEEFNNLLKGVLQNGESIQIYTIEDIKKGNIPNPFGRYAVALDFETAKATNSGYHKKKGFMENPLVLARVGTIEHLENYFDKANDSDGNVRNTHRLSEIDYNQQQGRLLYLVNYCDGLDGGNCLDYSGRFVGVAPEARAKK